MAAYIQYSFMFTLFVLILIQDERFNVRPNTRSFTKLVIITQLQKLLTQIIYPKLCHCNKVMVTLNR